MFFKRGEEKEEINFDKVDTLIGLGTHFQGVISSQGVIRVDGSFVGEIKNQGDLIIGDKGVLEANVEAKNIFISGQIKGNVYAKGKVEITATGKVFGDIRVKNLIIDDGAVFKGTCIMENPAKNENKPKTDTDPQEAAK